MKHIILSLSKTFQNLDTKSQTEYVSATSVIITESTTEHLILNMVDILKSKASNPDLSQSKKFEGYGTSLKPAYEPILVAMKPIDGTFANNALKHGQAGINIDACRIEYNGVVKHTKRKSDGKQDHVNPSGWKEVNRTPNRPATATSKGRFPANIILDEEASRSLDEQSGTLKSGFMAAGTPRKNKRQVYARQDPDNVANNTFGDRGGASRFFYCAKASKAERNMGMNDTHPTTTGQQLKSGDHKSIDNPYHRGGTVRRNTHPTVKPLKPYAVSY